MTALPWVYDDGGRAAAGFRGEAADCVVRAIAIATDTPYREVYDGLMAMMPKGYSPRLGVGRPLYDKWMTERVGWRWKALMRVGTGTTVHMRQGELPTDFPIIARLSKHLSAVVNGTVRDTYDPCRNGTRAVYGLWMPPN